MSSYLIRPYHDGDLEAIKRITIDSFAGVTLEQNVEVALGVLAGHDWRWRKARHVDDDVKAHKPGIFVADAQSRPVGYISSVIDREAGKGRIPNLAVVREFRGLGVGRALIEHVLEYFRREGLTYAVIETMAQNDIGLQLYTSCGFVEVARQIHFARRL